MVYTRGVKHAARGPGAAHQLIQSGPEGNFIKRIGRLDGFIFLVDFFTLFIITQKMHEL